MKPVLKLRRGNKVNAGEKLAGVHRGEGGEVTYVIVERPRKPRKSPPYGKTRVVRVPEGCLEEVRTMVEEYKEACKSSCQD